MMQDEHNGDRVDLHGARDDNRHPLGAIPPAPAQVNEQFVIMEFEDNDVTKDYLNSCQSYEISGLDTPHPLMRLGADYYKGRYEDIIGSEIVVSRKDAPVAHPAELQPHVFAQRPQPNSHNTHNTTNAQQHKPAYAYTCHTSKRLIFSWVRPVAFVVGDSQSNDSTPMDVS
eukprot:Opistho-2@87954